VGFQSKKCTKCKKVKTTAKFAKGRDKDQFDFWCNDCRKSFVTTLDRLEVYCSENQRNFNIELWNKCMEIAQEMDSVKQGKRTLEQQAINLYFSKMNLGGQDGVTEKIDKTSDEYYVKKYELEKKEELTPEYISYLEDKWGFGYKIEELIAFEKKYQFLKNNYPEKTSMHTEALLKYIRYSVKEEMATAQGNVSDAKSWGQLAKDAATAAKINPSQLSASDLTGGLNSFSELIKAAEQVVDIIPILPQFKYRPNDALDFVIWCYVNYVRDLKGLPLCEYEDIYEFYDRRKKEYIDQYGDPYGIFKDDPTEENRDKIKKFIYVPEIQNDLADRIDEDAELQ
jgi:hypothetical protein